MAILNPVSAATLEVGPGKTYATIGAAIAAANNGDTITVYPGTYNENIVINKSLTIQGADKSTTKIRGTAGEINTVSIRASNVTLKNFTIYNDQRPSNPNPSSAIFLIEIGYQSYEVSNIVLDNNIIGPQMAADGSSGGGMAIAVGGCSSLTGFVKSLKIINNEIRDIKGNGCGIFLWGRKHPSYTCCGCDSPYNGLVQNVLIENNYIHDIRRTGIESAGNVKDISIKNNTIKNCGNMFVGDTNPKYGNGIVFFKNGTCEIGPSGADSERRNIQISNNVLENISNIGIYLFGSSHDITIDYNKFVRINKYAIMLDSQAGEDTPDPSRMPAERIKQKDDAFSNIKLIRNIFSSNGKNIEIRTTYSPIIVNSILEGSMERIVRILGLGKSKPTGEIIEEK